MIKLTGLWVNESKDGKTKFFAGSLGSARILIMRNSFKEEGSNEPDYNMYIEEQLKKKEVPKTSNEINDNNDIPF